jgi:hypothetical protein
MPSAARFRQQLLHGATKQGPPHPSPGSPVRSAGRPRTACPRALSALPTPPQALPSGTAPWHSTPRPWPSATTSSSQILIPVPLCAPLPLPGYLKLGPAVRCRSPPEFPFRFIWVLGWSTWYLCANDPTPCTCKTNYLRVLVLFNIFFHFRRSFASSCHSGTCNSLNSGFTRRTSLRCTAASSATSAESCVNSPSSHRPSSHRPSCTPLLLLLLLLAVKKGGSWRDTPPSEIFLRALQES